MRLLHATTRQLWQFFDEQRPPYAILSHTWGNEEVLFADFNKSHENGSQHPSAHSLLLRAGDKKIDRCCHQALRDGFEWVWVDTCCIDKSSSAELSEAINSMFRWYKDAELCYAFLVDVEDSVEDISAPKSSFRTSRWFTRGWTLQELLAPRKLQFFSSNWELIGELTKGSQLSDVVSEITSVPSAFLEGLDLRTANLAMRMSWASKRTTTRKEDIAYCLLGIFDVNMPLLYGEGVKAFRRLQEEIMKRTYDHTLLAWGLLPWNEGYLDSDREGCGVLATSPAAFANSGSLNICPRPRNHDNPLNNYQITNEGLRIELLLYSAHSSLTGPHHVVAILDCFCRREPLRRIAIRLVSVPRHKILEREEPPIQDGDIFIRKGPSLLLANIAPDKTPSGYWFWKTIRILIEKDTKTYWWQIRSHHFHYIDFPRDYRCEVKYVHPKFKVEKNPLTLAPRSLHITTTLPWYSPLECGVPWISRLTLISDIIRNVFSGRCPYAQVRPQLDSIVVFLQLSRENTAQSTGRVTSFIVFLYYIPSSIGFYMPEDVSCSLTPISEDKSQVLPTHHSGMPHRLVGYEKLTLGDEIISVRTIKDSPDNLNRLKGSTLFKIDVEQASLFRPKLWIWVQAVHWRLVEFWEFLLDCGRRNIAPLGLLLAYGVIVNLLAIYTTNGQDYYLAVWALCYIPMVYEVKRHAIEGNSRLDNREAFFVRLIVMGLGVGFSMYPMLKAPLGLPTRQAAS